MNRYKSGGPSKATATTLCQKCLKRGHYSYECTATQQDRPYVSRPSRSQQFANPKLAPKLSATMPEPTAKATTTVSGSIKEKSLAKEQRSARKRSRSVSSYSSYSSGSVSTISTNRSHSRARSRPRKARDDRSAGHAVRSNQRRDSSVSRNRESHKDSRQHSRDRSPERRDHRRRERPPRTSHDRSRSPVRRRSPDQAFSRRRSRSRSPYRGGRNERDGREARSPTPPDAPRERSLSPYTRRMQLSKAMNGS